MANDDWGIPNWRNPHFYGAVESWKENRWRWEFMRRRKDYRIDFDRYADASYAHAIEFYRRRLELFCIRMPPDDHLLKPTDPGFTASMPGPRKYGLLGLPNPRISDQPAAAISFLPTTYCWYLGCQGEEFLAGGKEGSATEGTLSIDLALPIAPQLKALQSRLELVGRGGVSFIDLPEGTVAIKFDFALPIAPQLKGVQSELEAQQKLFHGRQGTDTPGPRRPHRAKRLTYLRLLDGKAAGASLSELGVVLPKSVLHTPQTAAQQLRAARSLMDKWPDYFNNVRD